ncbi:hypothetical protein DPX39_100109700 [Trypanosoma brucei equiperdum]|uniref:Uncharacterized protein n=1 Tax=Trypanosoma brucei equiperdum TaxID=630700 RepID=A0A3L6KZX5_9TRYP|nr:hypothetical protein DPX39_100109700 [Trypanosoma brucei equiperdum]
MQHPGRADFEQLLRRVFFSARVFTFGEPFDSPAPPLSSVLFSFGAPHVPSVSLLIGVLSGCVVVVRRCYPTVSFVPPRGGGCAFGPLGGGGERNAFACPASGGGMAIFDSIIDIPSLQNPRLIWGLVETHGWRAPSGHGNQLPLAMSRTEPGCHP